MHEKLTSYLTQAIKVASNDEKNLKCLISAREVYEKLTGKIDEDQDDYELRILGFNDWFLLDFIPEDKQVPFIIEFLNNLSESVKEIKEYLSDVHYSIFECRRKMWGKDLVLENFLDGKKYQIPPKSFPADILSNEIFVGRVVEIDKKIFFFKGIRWLPKEVRSLVVRKAKKIQNLGDPFKESMFIFSLEKAATKCAHFKHVNAIEIFSSYIK